MGLQRFVRPKGRAAAGGESSSNLYVANCGPTVGFSFDTIASVFSNFGRVKGVFGADDSGTRVIVSFCEQSCAELAMNGLNGHPCRDLGGRYLHIRYSVLQQPSQVSNAVPVSLVASEVNIPGLHLLQDFITEKEEEDLLAAVDSKPWMKLAKRRVQHYGYEFCYDTRNINTEQRLGNLPSFVTPVLERISSFPDLGDASDVNLDQLTVNEYPPGVGLSPHIDTHSAFEGLIFSLSLAGPCIMEFRRYSDGVWIPKAAPSTNEMKVEEDANSSSHFLRRAIYLPPRSMLLLSGEARYAWHHYIPHHKVDLVNDNVVKRGSRRVSFTLRKIRRDRCQCEYAQYCDSQS